ncbi:MAG: molybdopterin oxidoreductase family protein [Polyangia bacterium]
MPPTDPLSTAAAAAAAAAAPPAASSHLATCPLCEASCGLRIETDGERVLSVRGDEADPLSRGYLCPKAVALADLHDDPDRLRRPLKRTGDSFREIGWDEAFDEAAQRLAQIQREHGRDAVALYIGNPTAHSYSAVLYGFLLLETLRTRSFFTSNSVDSLPRLLTSYLLYGAQALLPIPDLDRTSFLLILGANPIVSNGSIMTAPDCKQRLHDLRARGGRIIVVDPRRTETAELADRHHFIRPGADALLLLGLLHTLFAERRVRIGELAGRIDGLAQLRRVVAPFSPARIAPATGIAAAEIVSLARAFADAPSAVCYGRMGTCTQEFGTLSCWLIDCLNILTGNLDRPGGALFTTPAVDLRSLASLLGQDGHFDRWRSRVSGLPEFNRELPVAALAEEIETPGRGQIRALVTHAGNPALSLPNGRRLDRALARLDFMVSIDIYLNETTRHADLILPPLTGLERDHYGLLFHALAIRNTTKYNPAVFAAAAADPTRRADWQIFLELSTRLLAQHGPLGRMGGWAVQRLGRALPPSRLIDLALRTGPHRQKGLTLQRLREAPHGIDLGPLEPQLPRLLRTPGRRIDLTPRVLVDDLQRLAARLADEGQKAGGSGDGAGEPSLLLIGRRQLRSNNSWMHNSLRLVKGKSRCTLLMHPTDAAPRGLRSGQSVRITSRVGAVITEVELSDEVMPGVVSLPHGWGHDRPGARLQVASQRPGVSMNDLTDEALRDRLSGCSILSGVPVRVTAAEQGAG